MHAFYSPYPHLSDQISLPETHASGAMQMQMFIVIFLGKFKALLHSPWEITLGWTWEGLGEWNGWATTTYRQKQATCHSFERLVREELTYFKGEYTRFGRFVIWTYVDSTVCQWWANSPWGPVPSIKHNASFGTTPWVTKAQPAHTCFFIKRVAPPYTIPWSNTKKNDKKRTNKIVKICMLKWCAR